MKPKTALRKWQYTVNRWMSALGSGHHYHVTIFPDCQLREVFPFRSGVDHQQKFNAQEESEKFIRSVRGRLARKGIKFQLIRKELDL